MKKLRFCAERVRIYAYFLGATVLWLGSISCWTTAVAAPNAADPGHLTPGSRPEAGLVDTSRERFEICNQDLFKNVLCTNRDLEKKLELESAVVRAWVMNMQFVNAKRNEFPKVPLERALTMLAHQKTWIDPTNKEPAFVAHVDIANECYLMKLFNGALKLKVGMEDDSTKQKKKLIEQVGSKLNKIEEFASEWGRATVSDIAFIDNKLGTNGMGLFALDYNEPTDFYMQQARQNIQGSAALSISTQSGTSILGEVNPGGSVPASVLAQALTNGTANATNGTANLTNNSLLSIILGYLATNSSATVVPTNAVITNSNSTNTTATNATTVAESITNIPTSILLASNSPTTLVVQTNTPQLSENTVLKIGATDKETELMLDYMTDPVKLPDNKKAFLGVMQVSVLPGWRTRRGYIGEVQVSFQYSLSRDGLSNYWKFFKKTNTDNINLEALPSWINSKDEIATELQLPVGEVPTVIAAFPFAEAQVLDLASSRQQQINFLLQLAAEVPHLANLQASVQQAFSKLIQQQLQTRNALPLVVPSSHGADVTYQFDPELQALVDPASTSSQSGEVLEPSSFPALVVIICNENELLHWDSITASVETRWIPARHRNWFKRYSYDWWRYGLDDQQGTIMNNQKRLENARLFDLVGEKLEQLLDLGGSTDDYAFQEAERRFESLKPVAMGRTLYSPMPPVKPHVAEVVPEKVRRDLIPDTLRIEGQYFKTPFSKTCDVIINGVAIRNPKFLKNNREIIVNLSCEEKRKIAVGKTGLQLISGARVTTWTNALMITPVPQPVISNQVPARLIIGSKDFKEQRVTLLGDNFLVGDDSLRVLIGNTLSIHGTNLSTPTSNGKTLEITLSASDLKSLPIGPQEIMVETSGGAATWSNSIVVDGPSTLPDANAPVISDVFPKHGFFFTNTWFGISGKNFKDKGKIEAVLVGGESCPPNVISDSILLVSVPPLGKWSSTNELALASNSFDVSVVTEAGIGTKTNAIVFDQLLSYDPRYSTPLTPQEQQIGQLLRNVFHTARILGTNPVLQTEMSVGLSIGDKAKSGGASGIPNITASLTINTNTPSSNDTSSIRTNATVPLQR